MKIYAVKITETLQLVVECSAESEEEAVDIIRYRYKDGVHVLGAEHFIDAEFAISKNRE